MGSISHPIKLKAGNRGRILYVVVHWEAGTEKECDTDQRMITILVIYPSFHYHCQESSLTAMICSCCHTDVGYWQCSQSYPLGWACWTWQSLSSNLIGYPGLPCNQILLFVLSRSFLTACTVLHSRLAGEQRWWMCLHSPLTSGEAQGLPAAANQACS